MRSRSRVTNAKLKAGRLHVGNVLLKFSMAGKRFSDVKWDLESNGHRATVVSTCFGNQIPIFPLV